MKVTLNRLNKDYHFETVNERGDVVHLDNKTDAEPKGASPMDLLLRAIAGCSSIDIVMILKKQHLELDDLRVEVEGYREDGAIPNVFKRIQLNFVLEGDLPSAKVKRAVDLSMEKYCSVSKMLEKAAEINYAIILNDEFIN